MLFSSRPAGAVKVGVLKLIDLGQEVAAYQPGVQYVTWLLGRAAFVLSRMELANDASYIVPYVPDEGGRVSLGGKDIGSHDARVVDIELDGLDADFVLRKRNEAGIASDGEVGSVAIFADDEAALACAVGWVGEVLLRHVSWHSPRSGAFSPRETRTWSDHRGKDRSYLRGLEEDT